MRWILTGALLGLLIAYPSLLALVVTVAAAIASKPLVVAFAAGVLARPAIGRRVRGWAR
ncbi:hypothetical protein ABT167_27465 [Streptomyces sp. NPDC001792]|uniref:hypothetical protein n=1 Tax=Streptomyces sp. NPDC001792 TaxID=3154524 RepID=UPI003328A0F5